MLAVQPKAHLQFGRALKPNEPCVKPNHSPPVVLYHWNPPQCSLSQSQPSTMTVVSAAVNTTYFPNTLYPNKTVYKTPRCTPGRIEFIRDFCHFILRRFYAIVKWMKVILPNAHCVYLTSMALTLEWWRLIGRAGRAVMVCSWGWLMKRFNR